MAKNLQCSLFLGHTVLEVVAVLIVIILAQGHKDCDTNNTDIKIDVEWSLLPAQRH